MAFLGSLFTAYIFAVREQPCTSESRVLGQVSLKPVKTRTLASVHGGGGGVRYSISGVGELGGHEILVEGVRGHDTLGLFCFSKTVVI